MKREGDSLKDIYVASTHDTLMIFTSFGRCYWIKVWQIPESGRRTKGKPLINLLEDIQPGEKIATVLRVRNYEEEASILLATRKGVVKKTVLAEFSSQRRKGVYAINIDEGDEVIAARIVRAGEQIMLFTRNGMAVRFDENLIRAIGRVARGVRGVTLKNETDYVVSCEIVTPDKTVLIVCDNGFGKRSLVEDFRQTNRGGVGVRSIITSERNGLVIAALSVIDTDGIVLMSNLGQTIRISMQDVRVMVRTTQGVRLVNLPDNDVVVAVQKLEEMKTPAPKEEVK